MYVAKLIASDKFEEKKQFSEYRAALDWLKGEGLERFEDDVERAELWSPEGKLVYCKIRPKTVNQHDAQRSAIIRAGLYWSGRPSSKYFD